MFGSAVREMPQISEASFADMTVISGCVSEPDTDDRARESMQSIPSASYVLGIFIRPEVSPAVSSLSPSKLSQRQSIAPILKCNEQKYSKSDRRKYIFSFLSSSVMKLQEAKFAKIVSLKRVKNSSMSFSSRNF